MGDYEARFASIFGADYHAFSFWKGRVGLYAILRAMELNGDDEVILAGYTCVAVPNAIRFAGAKPVYADIVPGRFNLDPISVSQRITSRTRAIIVQHTYGIPADVEELKKIAEKKGLEIIEDCAHVLTGSSDRGKLIGSFGKAAFFSSQWSKPYTTGLGGIVITRDKTLAERLQRIQAMFENPPILQRAQLRTQYAVYRRLFKPRLYWYAQKSLHVLSQIGLFVGSSNSGELIGERPSDIAWKMSSFQQRAGIEEIKKLELNSTHRQLLGRYYSETFRRHGWPVYSYLDSGETRLVRYPLEVANKADLLKESSRAGIELGSWFETPLHPLSLNDHHLLDYRLGSCPFAESAAAKVVNLPLHERVTKPDAERIVDFILTHAVVASSPPAYAAEDGAQYQGRPI
jgi:perosamine synthetase